jgi:hypothetical protein
MRYFKCGNRGIPRTGRRFWISSYLSLSLDLVLAGHYILGILQHRWKGRFGMQCNVERGSSAWLAGEYEWLTEHFLFFFECDDTIDI